MPKEINPTNIIRTLENKDYIHYVIGESQRVISEEETRIRKKSFVILIAGTKGTGKTKFADTIYAVLQGRGYHVLSSRASKDADQEIYTKPRRGLLEKQKRRRAKWEDVVAAIRGEAASALERRVMPFLLGSSPTSGNEKRVVVLNRYPPVDTLVRQYLAGAPLQGVAQVLRGSAYAAPGYLTPDLVFILTCNGKEATKRVTYRNTHVVSEVSANLPPDLADEIDNQVRICHLVSGYDQATERIDITQKMFPGETYIINTSMPQLDYDNNPEAAMANVRIKAIMRANRNIDEIIMPKLRNGMEPK